MENIEKCSKNDRRELQRVGISLLHGIAVDKCSKNADTHKREFGYKSGLVSFPTRTPWKKLYGFTADQEIASSFGEARFAPINRCIYEQVHTSILYRPSPIYTETPGSKSPAQLCFSNANF